MYEEPSTFVENDFISENFHLYLAALQNPGHNLPHGPAARLHIHSTNPKDHRSWSNAVENIAVEMNA